MKLFIFLSVILVLDSLFIPELSFILILFHFFYLLLISRRNLSHFLIMIKPSYIYLYFVLMASVMGLFINELSAVFKDAWYFLKPVLYFCYGGLLITKIKEKYLYFALVYSALIAGFTHILPIILSGDFFNLTVDEFRDIHGQGSIIFSLSIISLYVGYKKRFFKLKLSVCLFFAFIIVLIFTSSRLWLVIAVIGLLHLLKNGKLFNSQSYILMLLSILYLSTPLNTYSVNEVQRDSFIDKLLFSMNEIKPKVFLLDSDIHNYWRGYETFQGVMKFHQHSNIEKSIGSGMGASINIDFGKRGRFDDAKIYNLTWLHNGYLATLLKVGFLGLFFIFYFHYRILNESKSAKDDSSILLYRFFLTTILLTTFLNGGFINKYDTLYIYLLLGYLFIKFNEERY